MGGRRVLVVDDDWWVVELLVDLLREAGYVAQSAPDGLAALELIERERPDVVLADVRMPRLDGPELARRLRAAGYPTAIVLTSGSVEAPPLDDLPDVRFVPKPLDPSHLIAAIEAALS